MIEKTDGSGNGSDGDNSRTCHYVRGMLAVRNSDGDNARRRLAELGIDHGEWDETSLRGPLGELDAQDIRGIRELVSPIRVQDPHEAARALRDGGIRASPIHGLGHLGHATVMSGDGPHDPLQSEETLDVMPAGDTADLVAVIDSGIVKEPDRPVWMTPPSVEAENRDLEAPDGSYLIPASHGTFVVSLIRRLAPEYAVWLARARPRNVPTDQNPHDRAGPQPTTELDVVAALDRLQRRLDRTGRQVRALNLSLGAHAEDPNDDDFLLAVQIGLSRWRERFPECPIYAAGGNVELSVDPNPVYPAAFDDVIGVGAVNANGDEIVWDGHGNEQPVTGRHWIDQRAPGVDRVGLSGNPSSPVVRWSGSSFACAEAVAASL